MVEGIDNDITEVETDIFGEGADATQRIYFLKREVIEFHHATSPLLAPLESLERGAFPNIGEQLRRYFRDVADHARRVDEQVTAQRELLTSILEANLALLGVQAERGRAGDIRLRGDHRRAHLPRLGLGDELRRTCPSSTSTWGYPAALAADGARASSSLHRFFRRIHWL